MTVKYRYGKEYRERAEAELREREQRAVAEYLDRIEQSLNI